MKENIQARVYVDFQNTDSKGNYILDRYGTIQDLEKNNITLREGMKLTFWSDDADDKGNFDPLVAEGIVEYNSLIKKWTARISKDSIKNESEVS